MNSHKLLLLATVALVSSVNAASVSFEIGANTRVAVPTSATTGTAAGSAYTLSIGRANLATLTSTSVFADINAVFTRLGDPVAFSNGYTAFDETTYAAGSGFEGLPLVAWITNGSNLNAVISGFSPAFPLDNAIPNTAAYAIDSGNAASLIYTVGGYSSQMFQSTGGAVYVGVLPAVPEPSAALLGAIGALGLLRRRRI